jgi:hypothetical protein
MHVFYEKKFVIIMCIDEVMKEILCIYDYQSVKLPQLGHLWPQTIQTTLNRCVLVTFK